MIRAFVALELDQDLKRAIGQAQTQAKDRLNRRLAVDARIQWVKPDSIHLTLKFLGDIVETDLDSMREALAARIGAIPRFSVETGGLGVFPDLRAPRVIWIGLHDRSGVLSRLAAEVEATLVGLGFPPERRPFNPHLTLARIKDKSREVGQALAASGAIEGGETVGSLPVASVSLMKSDLQPSGSVYTRLWEVPLRSDE
jgi:2'-5' RNA ligase